MTPDTGMRTIEDDVAAAEEATRGVTSTGSVQRSTGSTDEVGAPEGSGRGVSTGSTDEVGAPERSGRGVSTGSTDEMGAPEGSARGVSTSSTDEMGATERSGRGVSTGSTSAAGSTSARGSTGAGGGALERRLEAILMVADEPQSLVHLATAVAHPLTDVREAILRLVADFDGVNGTVRRGFELREVAGGWRIYVRPEHDPVVADFVYTQNPTRLSQAALETLAVIAYKQPISRGAVASIRAVNVDSVVRTLLGRGLITEAFTDSETGAINYATTDLLLVQLGINSLDELPLISPLLADGANGFEDLP
jgi:segregation and condensation protein B